MIRTLQDLIGQSDAEVFFRHFVEKQRWLRRTTLTGPAESLLPWSEIDRLIAKGGIPPEQLRIIVNRNAAAPNMYVDAKTNRIRSDALQEMTSQGATFVINGISQLVPSIAELAANIERDLAHHVSINCYASFGEHSAFHAHADNHDVLILQIAGSKHWRGYGVDEPYPLQGGHSELTTVVWDDVLHVGDVLYLPRGEVHAAVPVQRPCVHLTIGITEETGVDFLKWLGKAAESEEKLRMNLERNAQPLKCGNREKDIKSAMHALIDATPVADFFADVDRKRSLRAVSAINFRQRLRADSHLSSALLRRIDLEASNPDEIKIEIGGENIRLSNLARRALEATTQHDRVTLSALAAGLHCSADDEALIEALGDLARKALIEIDDPQL
jgi:hypothetical protein